MKNLLFIVFLFLLISPAFSQKYSYIIGEGNESEARQDYNSKEGKLYVTPYQGSLAIYNTKTVGAYIPKDGNIFSIKGKTITVYDGKTLKKIKSISIKNQPEDQKYIGHLQFQGETILFFSSIIKKKTNTLKCYFRKLNIETGTLGEEELILEAENNRLNSRNNGFHHVTFFPSPEFSLSQDGSKLLFSCRQQLHVYEGGMKLSWKTDKMYGKDTPTGFYDFQDGMIANDGTYYAAIKVFKNDGQPKLKWHDFVTFRELVSKTNLGPNYDVWVFKINKSGTERIKTKGLNGVLIHSIALHVDSQEKLIAAGLYYKDGVVSHSVGFISLDLKTPDAKPNYHPISKEITYQDLKKKAKAKEKEKEKKGVEYLNGVEVQNTEDGNLLLITEQNYGYDPSGNNALGTYADIFVTKISPKGDVIWMRRLPKIQIGTVSTTDGQYLGCASYKYLRLNKKHYFIYLDDKKNQELNLETKGKYCTSCRNGNLYAYILDANGKLSKETIFDLDELSADSQYDFKQEMASISDTEFIFPVLEKKKTYGLVKITIK
jgi:hypothetical protein